MSEELVDLVVVRDRRLAARIVKALRQAGIACSEFWPQDVEIAPVGAPAAPIAPTVVAGALGPFHVRVAERDLGQARDALIAAGLAQQAQTEADTVGESMREVARTGLQMHAAALRRFFADRRIAVQVWPARSHSVLGLFEADEAPYRIMVPAEQLAQARELLSKTDLDLGIDESRGPGSGAEL